MVSFANSWPISAITKNDIIEIQEDTFKNLMEEKVHTVAEQMPSFKGNVNQWLATNIQYPDSAAKNGIQGRVVVKFIVRKNGMISNAKVVKSADPYLDTEALRVINLMPRWNPGMNNGKPVSVWFTLPLTFKLQ